MPTIERIWEIDAFRGFAIIVMVIFHLVVDLRDFYNLPLEYLKGFWYYAGKLSATLFILLSGISSTLGRHTLRRGLLILCWGMILTIITYVYNSDIYIRFGILHLIGLSMILSQLFAQVRLCILLPVSLAIIAVGNFNATITVNEPFLFPVGLLTNDFASIDYYPLLPWFGVYLIGIIAGRTIYGDKTSLIPRSSFFSLLTSIGQHSLTIYLLHQPVLLLILYLGNKLLK